MSAIKGIALPKDKLFDDKVSLASDYSYGGGNGGESWRVKVKGCWISKFPALMDVLDWAEKRDNLEITKAIAHAERTDAVMNRRWKPILDENVSERINELIWGFLNNCLKGEAHRAFELAPWLNGPEGWRSVVAGIHRGRENRQGQLRKLIKNPPAITRLEDVERGIVHYDNLIREYQAVQGVAPTPQERKSDLLDMLPTEIRENLLWRATDGNKTYEEFRDHVRAQTNHVLFHRGKLKSQINSVDQAEQDVSLLGPRARGLCPEPLGPRGEDHDGPGVFGVEPPPAYGDDLDHLVGAIMRRMNGRGGRGPPGAGGRPNLVQAFG